MNNKGIARGDSKFRHFTFDDEDIIIKNGEKYYKVNYGKNALEGEYGEDEYDFVKCKDIIFLGRKPKVIDEPKNEVKENVSKTPENNIEVDKKPEVKKTSKTPRTKTSTKITKSKNAETTNITNDVVSGTNPPSKIDEFEYLVEEIYSEHVSFLQNKLNEFGKEGWELCGFNVNKSFFKDIHILVILKRKRG